ncbi:MAG: sugar phosphate isomerase/epimerase family protein, partial [bacterium]
MELVSEIARIGISTWVYFWRPLKEVLKDIVEATYSYVEIWADKTHLDPRISPDLSVVKDLLNSFHLKVHSLHAPFSGLDIASLDEQERENSLDLIKKSMESCSEIEGEIVIIHPCSTEISGDDQSYLGAINKTKDSLRTLAILAEKLGIRLAVENLPNIGGWSFGTDLLQLSKLVTKINNPYLGLCLDTGHSFVGKEDVDLSKDVFECGKNLITLHVQDTDGKKDRHWLPGQGIINWAQFAKDLVSIDYQGALTLEISGSPEFTERNVDNILSRGMES